MRDLGGLAPCTSPSGGKAGSDNSDHSVSGGDLQILEASYGASGGSNEVTGHLQSMVSGNSLSMYVSSSQLGGDPAFGQVKALTVRYSYGGSVYETSVQEGGMLMIPDTSHGGVGGGGSVDTGGGGGSSGRSPIWNDTDLFHVKSHTQQDGGGAQFRSYDFLLKSRENFSSQTQSLSLPFGASSSEVFNSEFTEEGAHYVFEERFSQSWLLDSSYPSGFYDWTIGTGDLSNRVEHTVYVSGGSYPFDVPEIIGGNWSGGSLVLDSSNPVIQISPWFGSDSNDRLEYGFWSPTGASGASASASSSSLNLDWMNLDL